MYVKGHNKPWYRTGANRQKSWVDMRSRHFEFDVVSDTKQRQTKEGRK